MTTTTSATSPPTPKPSAPPQARTTSYIYDLNDRLTRETDPEGHVRQLRVRRGRQPPEGDRCPGRRHAVRLRRAQPQHQDHRPAELPDPVRVRRGGQQRSRSSTPTAASSGCNTTAPTATSRPPTRWAGSCASSTTGWTRVITQTTAFGLPEAEVTRFVYDAEGNLRQVTDAAGKVSTQRFDDVYNLTSFTDNNGHTTTTAFDALNRQIRVTDALGGVTTYTYDLEDNLLTETDALGHQRSFQYDAKDRLITETDALGVQTTYAYDAVDNQVSITRAAEHRASAAPNTFAYNKDDQLVSQTDALGNTTTYAYDANHNVVSTTDANGHTTLYAYDAANQVTQHHRSAWGMSPNTKYDGKGNRTQVIDARGNAADDLLQPG